jgi:NAD(P)-dependent dehydrogenase (short-subunit alcohol dehydrogenase family)
VAALEDKTVLVIGRGSGIARAVALLSLSEGARVIVAGRDRATLAAAYDEPDVTAETVDITDDESIAALAERVGPIDTSCRPPRQEPAARSPIWTAPACSCRSTPR